MPGNDQCRFCRVASFTDAWIETISLSAGDWFDIVASFTDAWIETSRARYSSTCSAGVASFTDAWIETGMIRFNGNGEYVASFTDAWIETELHQPPKEFLWSRPSRTRGLKHHHAHGRVALVGRVLHGRVD